MLATEAMADEGGWRAVETWAMQPVLTSARSFRPRRRGLPPARAAAYEHRLLRWSIAADGPVLDLAEVFPQQHDVVLDIGFGGGEGVVEMAAARPHEAILGVEVHTPGVARVLDAIEANGWGHVRVAATDVLELLPRLPGGSLAGIRVWFPDPWPKNKQRHRRLVQPAVVRAWTDRLRPGGVLHVATDIADYAVHTEAVVAGEPRLRGGIVPRPAWRPLTRFEQRGLAAGRTVTDLWYVKTA